MGAPRSRTRIQVAEEAGLSLERTDALWRSLGFTSVGDADRDFGTADVEALKLLGLLDDFGVIHPQTESALVRTLGRSFARLAEWQTNLIRSMLTEDVVGEEDVEDLIGAVLPVLEQAQNYVWRRHLASAAARLLVQPDPEAAVPMGAGFADIVGFTRMSRQVSQHDLADLVDRFEAAATDVITRNDGRVIKTIGDEIMFVTDEPEQMGRIALEIAGMHASDPEFPQVRVGAAYGDVLSMLGDVYGPVVNIASRLTSLAKPGKAMIDRTLAELLTDDPEFRLRRSRRTSVRGYERLEPWHLRLPRSEDPAEPVLPTRRRQRR